jgi:hypothetical protein
MTTTPDIEILTLSLSKLRITMPLELVKPKNISGLELLDLNKRNYASWAESALDAFLYAGIREYVMGEVAKPGAGDTDLPIWTKNNNLAQAGIRMSIASIERDYIRDHCTITSAHTIWTALQTRHRQKASTQTSLLDDLLNIRIERGADMVDAAGRVRNISKQVFEVGPLDADKLSLAVLLRALSPELSAIWPRTGPTIPAAAACSRRLLRCPTAAWSNLSGLLFLSRYIY